MTGTDLQTQYLKAGLAFLDRQRIIQPAVNSQIGFDFQGLLRSYVDDPKHPVASLIARYGRMWIYDVALSIYADLKAGRQRQAGYQVGRVMQLALKEEEKGFRGIWHFSYNTLGDAFIDPRGPAGANAWCLNAIYSYILSTKDRSVLEWANRVLRSYFLALQVTDAQDPRYGLIRAGFFNVDDVARGEGMGYRVYEGDANYPYDHVILEHNADFSGTLRLAYRANQELQSQNHSLLEELIDRHDLLMGGVRRSFWQKDHFVSAMDGQGRIYAGSDGLPSVAVDNNTWAAHIFVPYDLDLVRSSIRYVEERFLVTTPPAYIEDLPEAVESPKLQGVFYFQSNFEDPFVQIPPEYRAKMTQLLHPEAAFGYILLLHDVASRLPEGAERDRFLQRSRELYEQTVTLQQLYGPSGAPYASANIPSIFSTLPSVTTAASGVITTSILQGKSSNDFIGVTPPADFKVNGQAPKIGA